MTTKVVKRLVAIAVAKIKRWGWLIWPPHTFQGWQALDVHYYNKLSWVGVTNSNLDKNIEFWSDKTLSL